MGLLQGGLILYKEKALGIVDGIRVDFSTTYQTIPQTIRVYLNGLEQTSPEDYTVTANDTIRFATPPLGGDDPDVVLIAYQRA